MFFLKYRCIWTIKMNFHLPFLGERSVHLPKGRTYTRWYLCQLGCTNVFSLVIESLYAWSSKAPLKCYSVLCNWNHMCSWIHQPLLCRMFNLRTYNECQYFTMFLVSMPLVVLCSISSSSSSPFFSHFLSPLAKINHLIPSCKKTNLQQKNDFCNGCMKKKGSVMDVWKLVNYLCFPNDKLFLLVDIKIFKFWRLCWHIS